MVRLRVRLLETLCGFKAFRQSKHDLPILVCLKDSHHPVLLIESWLFTMDGFAVLLRCLGNVAIAKCLNLRGEQEKESRKNTETHSSLHD